jgi:cobalt/nickel transport system permease protein
VTFVLLMQPIHLAIGIVEGLATTAVVIFVGRVRPEIITAAAESANIGKVSIKKVLVGLLAATVLTGGVLSWFASSYPDGLEWAMLKIAGTDTSADLPKGLHTSLAQIQEKTAVLPDYGFKAEETEPTSERRKSWPAVDTGATVSGLIGGTVTLLLAGLIGFALKRRRRKLKTR